MPECWLRPNRRAILLSTLIPVCFLATGAGLVWCSPNEGWASALCWLGWAIIFVAVLLIVLLLRAAQRPVLGYEAHYLLVGLNSVETFRVPIEFVECFFLGHGPTLMKDREGKEPQTSTVVVRLAEAAVDWHRRDVNPAMGHWCDGYIVIRGTWCEPIAAPLMQQLNERLIAAHRAQKAKPQSDPTPVAAPQAVEDSA